MNERLTKISSTQKLAIKDDFRLSQFNPEHDATRATDRPSVIGSLISVEQSRMSRRSFLRKCFLGSAGLFLSACMPEEAPGTTKTLESTKEIKKPTQTPELSPSITPKEDVLAPTQTLEPTIEPTPEPTEASKTLDEQRQENLDKVDPQYCDKESVRILTSEELAKIMEYLESYNSPFVKMLLRFYRIFSHLDNKPDQIIDIVSEETFPFITFDAQETIIATARFITQEIGDESQSVALKDPGSIDDDFQMDYSHLSKVFCAIAVPIDAIKAIAQAKFPEDIELQEKYVATNLSMVVLKEFINILMRMQDLRHFSRYLEYYFDIIYQKKRWFFFGRNRLPANF